MDVAIPMMRDAIISLAANMGLGIGELKLGWDAIKIVSHSAQLFIYYTQNDLQNMGYETGEIVFDLVEAVQGKGSITVDGYTVAFADEAIKANKAILERKLQ